jgi:hypothetical protein
MILLLLILLRGLKTELLSSTGGYSLLSDSEYPPYHSVDPIYFMDDYNDFDPQHHIDTGKSDHGNEVSMINSNHRELFL